MKYRDILPGREWLGKIEKDEDLLDSMTDFARKNQIRLGAISGIGALQKARIAIYDQEEKVYKTIEINEASEITNLTGNISMKNGEIFCHIHVTLSQEDGSGMGGHVCKGCTIFALEFQVRELTGDAFLRQHDNATGLPLWNI
jgi:uncharacterized protein